MNDVEQSMVGCSSSSAPTSSSSSPGDNAAYGRLVEKINKINMQMLTFASKEDLAKDVNALKDRWQRV
jgi:hypothetical protein